MKVFQIRENRPQQILVLPITIVKGLKAYQKKTALYGPLNMFLYGVSFMNNVLPR
jgi:hypothetical protein